MHNIHFRAWFTDTLVPFLKSIGVVIVFSPWLLVAYSLVSSYTLKLHINDQDAIRSFIEWFGTAYSFFLALAIVNVWSQFETVERELDRELDAISTLLQTVTYTEVSNLLKTRYLRDFKQAVREDIRRYIRHVLENYRLEQTVPEQHRNGDRILEDIGTHISTLTARKAVPEPFIYELFTSLNEAMDVRGDRISHSKPYTPVIVKLVAMITSLIWLISFLGLVIYDDLVAIILIGGVAFVIIMVLVIFFDLGEPFGGIWKIDLGDWQEFLQTIDHDRDPQVVFIYNLDNTPLGRMRAFLRTDTCPLYDLAHPKGPVNPWEPFLQAVERARPGGHPFIKCRDLYPNQLNYHGLPVNGSTWPAVLLKQGGDRKVFLDSQQIRGCGSQADFEALFHEKLKEQLPWYEP